MTPYILTKRDEYRLSFYISICLFMIIIPCFLYMLYIGINGKPLFGLLIITPCPLYSILRFIFFNDDNNYNTLVINEDGIMIYQGGTNEKLKWNNIQSIKVHLGAWRLDGLVMDVFVKRKKRVRFSFFNYIPGISIKKIKQAIRFYSINHGDSCVLKKRESNPKIIFN